MNTRLIAAALVATLMAGSAYAVTNALDSNAAQDVPAPPSRPGGVLLHADADKDGVITRAELIADVDARFAKRDVNKDGRITADERPAKGRRGGGAGPGGRMANRVDADKDGAVTLEEHRARAVKLFAYIDRNSDGKIDRAEREALRDVMMAMRGPGGKGGKWGHGPHRGHGRHGPPPADSPGAPSGE